ncbi:MAG: amidohydrolase family protein [Nitrospirales bacterium]
MSSSTWSRRPRYGLWRLLAVVITAWLLAVPSVGKAERPNRPRQFAIRNARLVPVSGPLIEKGTIVVADGLIQAIGTDVPVPPEAWVIEGEKLTVYPGLIDSLTTLGLQAPQQGGGEGRPSTGGAAQPAQRPRIPRGPEDRPATTPWDNAADRLRTDDRRLENWRKAGFTSAVTSPDRGIFPGQAAMINLAGERLNELVLATPVALRVNLSRAGGFRNFPGSLMGVFAYIKQVFTDVNHYDEAQSIYRAHPQGLERPAYDRTLEPIRRALGERQPVLLPATWSKEILRAVRFGEEVEANALIYGVHQGYEVADLLASKQLPVLVSLKWPEKARGGDPDAEEPLRILRFRDRAPSTPSVLQRAGVKFAFYSDGISNPRDILKNVRRAMEAGLSADAALRALTLSAAEIYGLEKSLGSLDAGKIANLTVTEGELFGEKTKIKMVFIDGKKYETPEPTRPTAPPTVNPTGQWMLSVENPRGVQEVTADLTMGKDGTLSGTFTTRRGTNDISDGWVSGNRFSFTVSTTRGSRTIETTYSGTMEGNELSGTMTLGSRSVDFSGTRPEGGRSDDDGFRKRGGRQ